MDEEDREKEQRDASDTSENKEKEHVRALFAKLRTLLQTHGYPVKGDRVKTAQSTTAVSQKEDKDSPESSREQSNWVPSFHTYEDFNHMTLQSLDGFMIILSTDGVIIFVDGNISSLLGYFSDEITGKTLLSLLPDQEKDEVYEKIALEFPLSCSGKHIEFCCHLKRGNVKHGSNPTYEYVKFILSIRDVSSELLVLFSSFFSRRSYDESYAVNLPLKDRFYLVGTVCVLRPQTLQELCTAKEAAEDIPAIEDSDEEHLSMEHRSVQGQRISSRMQFLHDEPDAAASDVKQYGSQESVPVIQIESDTSFDSSISSPETIPDSPATSSLQSFESEHKVENVDEVEEVEEVDQMDEMEEVEQVEEVEQIEQLEQEAQVEEVEQEAQVEEVEQEAQVEQVDQKNLLSSSLAADISDQPLPSLSSIASYIDKRELELMKKFKEQLEEKTQMLHADIRNQQKALEMIREQLQAMQESKFQMQPNTSLYIENPEPQSLEPVPKKRRTEQMKSLPDLKEAKDFCGSYSSHSFKFPEELEEPYDASTQQHLQEQEQYLQQQMQQEELLQEQPQQHNVVLGDETLQIGLPNQSSVSLPLYNDPVMFTQSQPVVPVQLGDEQQPSEYYQDENLGGQEDESRSFLPEDLRGSSMNLLSMARSPSSISSTSFPECLIGSDSNLVPLDTSQEYIHLWQQPPDPQHDLYLQEDTWSSNEQAILQDQAAWPQQAQAPEAGAQLPPSPEAFQAPAEYPPDQISYFVPAEQSSLDEHQHQQYFHTES
ncbi:circadian clock protein PASD1 isoform X4 [Equus przewalskii]|uniref:Circadian clock protein PASD1 isoform X4 n=1 Tax=Equus przewalskii TaxID=9798 RepID=A0ABM4N5B0_EQUPR